MEKKLRLTEIYEILNKRFDELYRSVEPGAPECAAHINKMEIINLIKKDLYNEVFGAFYDEKGDEIKEINKL